jgi:hypothetical protein
VWGWVSLCSAEKSLSAQPDLVAPFSTNESGVVGEGEKKMRDEFFVIRARSDGVLLRLLRMLREGCIDMKPLNRMDDDSLFRQVSIWFDPTSTTSVLSWESA